MYFAWITGLRGPEAQLWADEPVDGNGKPTKDVLFKKLLSKAEQSLSLEYLAMKFNKDKP